MCLGGERMFEKVREIIADKLSINEDEITMDSSFLEDLKCRLFRYR